MNKLSKEQADYLLQQIEEIRWLAPAAPDYPARSLFGATREIIHNFTDKEFPILRVGCSVSETMVTIQEWDTEKSFCVLIINDKYTHMTQPEFKNFAEQCNKIVGWIDEQKLGIR